MQRLALEEQGGEDGEDDERHHFLNDLELHQREGAAIAGEADAVGRNLARILEERDAPREEDDGKQGPMGGNLHLLQLQVPVPGEGHEDVGDDEQKNGVESFHINELFICSENRGQRYEIILPNRLASQVSLHSGGRVPTTASC